MIWDSPNYRSSLHRACEHSLVEEHPASSTIQCRFVNRFAGSIVPSRVSHHWFSPRDAPLPSFGSRRARFPALGSTMRALRLPMHASTAAYWFAAAVHASSFFRVRLCAPVRAEVSSGPGFWWCRLPQSPALARGRAWDLSGLQAIHPVPLLRSTTPVEPTCPRHSGHADAAPALRTAKASGDG